MEAFLSNRLTEPMHDMKRSGSRFACLAKAIYSNQRGDSMERQMKVRVVFSMG